MAKKSMIAREVKRIKTVEKYAEKRATLKKAMNDQSLSSEERYEARVKFQKFYSIIKATHVLRCRSLQSTVHVPRVP